ncbi:MAG TPA: aminotransferase class III-fold pyridoxal phosphate-dependent enzyme, partial [Pseudomonadota bacterium]|nr:aminotransferase class III-fold pyridoxal phosphate-dependent enzyme [Pseudomonadota bacterium]
MAEQNYLAPGIQQISTLAGIAVAGGEGALIEDVDGNRFLDWVAGIGVASIGHGHKALAQALSQQAASIVATSFASPARLELLARIVEH